MIIYPYKVRLYGSKAYIEDDEGIKYMTFNPHPDGDPKITKEGVEITLDVLNIPRSREWKDNAIYSELPLKIKTFI